MEREIIQDGTSLFKKDDFNFTYGRNYSKVFLGDLQGRTIGRSTHWAQGPGESPPAPRAPHQCNTIHIRGEPAIKKKQSILAYKELFKNILCTRYCIIQVQVVYQLQHKNGGWPRFCIVAVRQVGTYQARLYESELWLFIVSQRGKIIKYIQPICSSQRQAKKGQFNND